MRARAYSACLSALLLLLLAAVLYQIISLYYSVQFKLRFYPLTSRYNNKVVAAKKASETLCERFARAPVIVPATYSDISDTVRVVLREEHRDYFLKELQTTSTSAGAAVIPKHIYQTYRKADKWGRSRQIPAKVSTNIRMHAPGYNRTVYCDSEIRAFLAAYFTSELVQAFDVVEGPHKSDIFRYAKLFIDGGVYLDIKTILIKNLDTIFKTLGSPAKPTAFVCIAYNRCLTYNGIIASPKHNEIFLKLLRNYIEVNKPIQEYQTSNRFFHALLFNGSSSPHILGMGGGYTSMSGRFDYAFYEEAMRPAVECLDGPDKFGSCFIIFDSHTPIFGVRYPDYPWHSNYW